MKFAIVGLGSIGSRHARLLSKRNDVSVVLMDSSQQALAKAAGEVNGNAVALCSNWDAMIGTRPDAIVIATPHHLHVDQCRAALAAGCHVLCEKPVSDSLTDAIGLIELSRNSDRVLSFGFHLHFHPGMRRLKQFVAEGRLGALLHIACHVGSYKTLTNSVSRYQSETFGALLLDYVHQPDAIVWLSGLRPKSVYASGTRGGHRSPTADPDLVSVLYAYDAPFTAYTHFNYLQDPEVHRYDLVGSLGSVMLDLNGGTLYLHLNGQVTQETFSTERDPVYEREHQSFIESVAKRSTPESPIGEASVSLAIQTAALRSLRSGRPVDVDRLPGT